MQRNDKLHIGGAWSESRHFRRIRSLPSTASPPTERKNRSLIPLRLCVKTIEHEWAGNQAAQFQWALDNLPIETKWILRLDADEYLTDELIAEIKDKLPQLEDDVDDVVLKRRHVVGWLGNRWVKRGMYPTKILRLFRRGYGQSDMKVMDEHIIVQRRVVEFEHDFVDHSLISF